MLNIRSTFFAFGLLLTLGCQGQEPLQYQPSVKKAPAVDDGDANPSKPSEQPVSKPSEGETPVKGSEPDPLPVDVPMVPEMPVEPEKPDPLPPEMSAGSAGCGAAAALPEGVATFKQGTLDRKYTLRLPAGYKADHPYPLLLALHPNGGNSGYWDGNSGDRAVRKVWGDKAIIIMAQARAGDWRGDLPTELAYFETILSTVKDKLCIDTKRIYSMGFSGGGSFSSVLGCMRTDIRAFASGGGVIYYDKAKCVGKSAAWFTIGDKESSDVRKELVSDWRTRNSCTSESVTSMPATCQQYSCPNAERATIFCSHPGDHVWPSFGTEASKAFFDRFQ